MSPEEGFEEVFRDLMSEMLARELTNQLRGKQCDAIKSSVRPVFEELREVLEFLLGSSRGFENPPPTEAGGCRLPALGCPPA
jgi:hypothetical protein